MSASMIFDLAPIGSIVAWSDGAPRPPEDDRMDLVRLAIDRMALQAEAEPC